MPSLGRLGSAIKRSPPGYLDASEEVDGFRVRASDLSLLVLVVLGISEQVSSGFCLKAATDENL